MNDHGDNLRHPLLLLIGASGLTFFLLWVSNLTAGPEHGAKYDVPAVNYPAWFAFLLIAAAAIALFFVNLARLGAWIEGRRERRSVDGTD